MSITNGSVTITAPDEPIVPDEPEVMGLSVSSAQGAVGETVAVELSISDNPGLASLKFSVAYDDSALTLTNVAFADGFGENVTAPEPYASPQTISMISPFEEITTNGVFATLTFAISPSAAAGTSAITVTYDEDDVCDGDFNNVVLSVTAGDVTITTLPDSACWDYTVSGGKAVIKGYTGASTDIVIPGTIDGYTVTSIGSSAFTSAELTSVVIPDSVKTIGTYAFRYCASLADVQLGTGLTSIGDSAFYGCTSLTAIELPESVTSIGSYAFYGCTALTDINLPSGLTKIKSSMFYGCSSLPAITIPSGVATIGASAFNGCKALTQIVIPSGATLLDSYSFFGCEKLESIVIPDSVTTIGTYSFYGCKALATVYYGGSEEQWNAISIGSNNSYLRNANIIFNSTGAVHEHSYTAVVTAPSCTEGGYTTYTCSCGDSYTANETAALGHLWGDWVVTTPAQIGVAGVETRVCSRCEASETRSIEPLPSPEPDPDAPRLVVSDVAARAGQQFSVTVSIENNPGIAGLMISLSYDTSVLTLNGVSNGGMFSGFSSGKNYLFDEDGDVTEDGVLMTLNFTVAEEADAGDYQIGVSIKEATNYDLDDIDIFVVPGTVTVIDVVYGDANGDGEIGMKDIVLIRRYLSNYDEETGTSTVEVSAGADANGDGSIGMKDIVIIRRYLSNYDEETGTSTIVLGPQ